MRALTARTIDAHGRAAAGDDALARTVRGRLDEADVVAFNLVASPGAGTTTLLERTLDALGAELRIAVVSRATDGAGPVDALQLTTALDAIDLDDTDLLLIDNVGSVACPAGRDLGDDGTVVLLSVTEGEDRPLRCPTLFRHARQLVLTRLDLLPHVAFDLKRAVGYARDVNPNIGVFFTSAATGEGMAEWYDFLRDAVKTRRLTGRGWRL